MVALAAVTLAALFGGIADAAASAVQGDPLIPTGQLLASDAPGAQNPFVSVAMSSGVAVAGAPHAKVGPNQDEGVAYVFTEPAGGWATETEEAKLVESDGQAGDHFGALVASSRDAIVVGRSASPGAALYVFTQPPDGWSGTLHESAQLTVADPQPGVLTSIAISGDTIVAGFRGAGAAAYVFIEPGGGWSGTIHESAKLVASGASNSCFQGLDAVAVDTDAVVAGSISGSSCNPGIAYVFTQPASGWSGTLQERARLVVPSDGGVQSVAASGSSLVAVGRGYNEAIDPVVFNEPAGGWSGTIRPVASLKVSVTGPPSTDLVAGSGDEIAATVVPELDECVGLPFGCERGTLYAFSKPPAGWRGVVGGVSRTVGGGYRLANAGRTIATEGVAGIELFTAEPGAPSAGSASLSGLSSAKPKLRFTLDAGQGAAPIRSFELNPPSGLRLARDRTGRATGVHITGPQPTVKIRDGTLTATLRSPVESLYVTITPPALIERQNLIASAQRIRTYNTTHRRKRVLTMHVRCVVTDAAGHRTPLTLKFRIS